MDGKDFVDPEYLVDHMKQFYLLLGVNWVLTTLLGAVAQGMMIKAVADVHLEQASDFKDCFKIGLKKGGRDSSRVFAGDRPYCVWFLVLSCSRHLYCRAVVRGRTRDCD